MILETERLILRPFTDADAESVYEYAKDPDVGPNAGWPVHTSVENSREIIRNVLAVPETYAICLKADNTAIGAVGLMTGTDGNLKLGDKEGEIGYWLGKPFWGQGIVPEAVNELIRHAFYDLQLEVLWCGYFDGNRKSARVQEKCGFLYHHTRRSVRSPFTGEILTEHVSRLSKDKTKLYVYIHGKGGSAEETEHYAELFPKDSVTGFDYKAAAPWEACREFKEYLAGIASDYVSISIIANSIGAFFALCSLQKERIEKAYFISPIVDMEGLIENMLQLARVTEKELEEKKEIETEFGETLSWEYLTWVRENPVSWEIPTEILYGSGDELQPEAVIRAFAEKTGAGITVMENGEHWFHTEEQMKFLDSWLTEKTKI